MKVFTLFELQQFSAYPILKSANYSEAEIQIFFNIPEVLRAKVIPNKSVVKVAPPQPKITPPLKRNELRLTAPPKKVPMIFVTQKCTSTDVTLQNIKAMAMEHMNMDFGYRGKLYNMAKDGWKFAFNERKTALGLCASSRWSKKGTIYLSSWIIQNSEQPFDKWVNVMLHEIAHAIDVMIQGESSHDWKWKDIARSIGCDAERTTKVEYADLLKNPISKYTMVCPNGHTRPSHKVKRRESSCRRCNEAIGGKGFNRDFLLEQVTNW